MARTDPAGARVSTAYDAVSRISQVTDRDGRTIACSYDNADRVTGEEWKNNSAMNVNVAT